MYYWIQQVVLENLPFSFVDKEVNRSNSCLKPICSQSLKDAITVITKKIEEHISKILPNKFALIFDGWSSGDSHYVGVFVTFMEKNVRKQFLIAMSPMEDETTQSAAEHKEFLTKTLRLYGKSLDNVCALIGDNCSTNKALATSCNVPLIGCFSHILNLAVKNVLLADEEIKEIIEKVAELMRVLKTTKGAAHLRNITDLKAVKKNDTRWTSSYDMLARYIRLLPSLLQIEEETVIQKLPAQVENLAIKMLLNQLEKVNKMMIYLQRDDINLKNARGCFDALLKAFPATSVYLAPDARIVHSPEFISAVVKIQRGETSSLSDVEKRKVEALKVETEELNERFYNDNNPENAILEFLEVEDAHKAKKQKVTEEYIDLDFLVPTSNCVERLFSIAKYVYTPERQRMLPMNLEMLLFLKVNEQIWTKKFVCEALQEARVASKTVNEFSAVIFE